tara:strand:- start:422897 stop:423037 length:141 start_codon:yes stop_codon:yes gene_type:complete
MTINWIEILNHFLDGVMFGTGFFVAFSCWAMWIFKSNKKNNSKEQP